MSENQKFELFCKTLNQECIRLQDYEKEYIPEEIAFEAYAYISQMKLELPGDFILFLSALNLLNTYVKQPGTRINYSFKKQIDYFLEVCLRKNKNILKINKNNDAMGKLLMIKLNDIQFSFHGVNCQYEGIDQNLDETMQWDGIRKQKCAVSIYQKCKDNQILRANITYRGTNLLKKVNKYVDNYKKGYMNFNSRLY